MKDCPSPWNNDVLATVSRSFIYIDEKSPDKAKNKDTETDSIKLFTVGIIVSKPLSETRAI